MKKYSYIQHLLATQNIKCSFIVLVHINGTQYMIFTLTLSIKYHVEDVLEKT